MNPGTKPTTDLNRQTSTLTDQLGESTDSLFLYYKIHFFLSILDERRVTLLKGLSKAGVWTHPRLLRAFVATSNYHPNK